MDYDDRKEVGRVHQLKNRQHYLNPLQHSLRILQPPVVLPLLAVSKTRFSLERCPVVVQDMMRSKGPFILRL